MAPSSSIECFGCRRDPSRTRLLGRLRLGDDVEGWQESFRIEGDLLRHFARPSGLSVEEAEEILHETAIGVARNLPGFRDNPTTGSFKTWMHNLARWRIVDAQRRRGAPGVSDLATMGKRRHGSRGQRRRNRYWTKGARTAVCGPRTLTTAAHRLWLPGRQTPLADNVGVHCFSVATSQTFKNG